LPEVERNGWTIRAHALVLDQFEAWIVEAEADHRRQVAAGSGEAVRPGRAAKLAVSLRKLMLADVPANPLDARYRHGGTERIPLHFFRAKFGNGRYRLFYQAKREHGRILFAWVNSDRTLRTYGSKADAYAVFRKMLDNKVVPQTWDELDRAIGQAETTRLREMAQPPGAP